MLPGVPSTARRASALPAFQPTVHRLVDPLATTRRPSGGARPDPLATTRRPSGGACGPTIADFQGEDGVPYAPRVAHRSAASWGERGCSHLFTTHHVHTHSHPLENKAKANPELAAEKKAKNDACREVRVAEVVEGCGTTR